MSSQRNDQSNTPSGNRDLGNSSTLGGAGAGTKTFYMKDGFVYDSQTSTQLGRVVDAPSGTQNSSSILSSSR